jgi:hypothetical protein
MIILNRRQFVTGATAFLAAPSLGRAATAWTCTATSGRRLIGRLTTPDPERHEAALIALRAASGYSRPLIYSSTDRLKLPFAQAAIRYVGKAGDLSFAVEQVTAAPRLTPVQQYPELEGLTAFLTGCAYGAVVGTSHPLKQTLIRALRTQTTLIS